MKADDTTTASGPPHPPGTQAIDRALEVLSGFVTESEQGITDIARRSGLSPGTAHRIVRALVSGRYLEQNPVTGRYHLGHAAVVLGQSARETLGFDRAIPALEQLGGETGESVNLGVRDGRDVVVLARVQSVQPLRFDQPAGTRLPLHCSSMGKALLAFGDDDLTGSLAQVTPATISDTHQLQAELRRIRDLGYSTDNEESIVGVSCVGAPVLNAAGTAVAAIAVQAPTVRMPSDRQERLGRRVIAVAKEIRAILRLDALDDVPGVASESEAVGDHLDGVQGSRP